MFMLSEDERFFLPVQVVTREQDTFIMDVLNHAAENYRSGRKIIKMQMSRIFVCKQIYEYEQLNFQNNRYDKPSADARHFDELPFKNRRFDRK